MAAHGQTLYSVSEKAGAGEAIALSGEGLANASRVQIVPILEGREGAAMAADVAYVDQNQIVAKMPQAAGVGMYRVAVTTPDGTSNSLYMNRPRVQWLDSATAAVGESVRIVGRNLNPFPAYTPKVRLQSTRTGAYLNAKLTAYDDEQIRFETPAGVVSGQIYKVFVDNGLPGALSEINTGYTLTMSNGHADPFALGTTWADDFSSIAANVYDAKSDPRLSQLAKGDGKVDDTAAVQAAILTAYKAGGGTVYLPAGTYRLDAGGYASLTLYPKVVLKGAGMGKTVVQIGYKYTKTVAPAGGYWMQMKDPGQNGLKDMTVRNLNANATANRILRQGAINGGNNRMFLADVDFQMGNGDTIYLTYITQALIARCKFVSTCAYREPLTLANCNFLKVQDSLIDYRSGRISMAFGDRNIFERNTLRLDNGNSDPKDETGGLEFSISRRLLVCDNTIEGYNGTRRKDANDGEMIMTQNTFTAEYGDAGTVASANFMKLSPAGKKWPSGSWLSAKHTDTLRTAVAIVEGKGKGQWRWVAGHNATSLTVDTPWTTVPDGTSEYVVTSVSSFQHTYLRNRIENGRVGIQIYAGALDTLVDSNTLVNTGIMGLRADARYTTFNGAPMTRQFIAWNNQIRNNTLQNTTGYWSAAISAYSISGGGAGYGTSLLNTEIRNNVITGNYTVSSGPVGIYDGIEVAAINAKNANADQPNAGTILSGNLVSGSLNPYRLDSAIAALLDGALTTLRDPALLVRQ